MPRKDRRSRTPPVFGKPDISYPQASLEHPEVVESFSVRQRKLIPQFLTQHENGSQFPEAKITTIDGTAGDNTDFELTLRYETLPGVEIQTFGRDPIFNNKQTRYVQRVEAGTDLPVLGDMKVPGSDAEDVGSQLITGATLQMESAVVGRLETLTENLPSLTVTAKEFDEYGALVTTTQQKVVAATTPTNTVVTGTPHVQSLTPKDRVVAVLTDESRAIGVIVDEIEKVDSDVPGSKATVAYYLVLASTTIPADTSTITYERRRFPKDKNLRVEIKTTYVTPSSYVEDVDGSYPFPTLFESAVIVDGTSFGLLWKRRQGFSKLVIFKHYHSFGTSRVEVTPDALIPASWTEPFGFSDTALTPGATENRTYTFTDQDDNVFSDILPASTPSREEYIDDWIGQEKIVGGSSRIWRAGIYKTTIIRVIMQ